MQIYFGIGKIQSMQMYFAFGKICNPCKNILQFGKIQPMQIYIAIWKNTIRANIFSDLEKYNLRKYIFQFGKIQSAQIYFPIWTIPTGKAAVVSRREQLTSVWGTCWQPRHHKMHKSTSNPHQHIQKSTFR